MSKFTPSRFMSLPRLCSAAGLAIFVSFGAGLAAAAPAGPITASASSFVQSTDNGRVLIAQNYQNSDHKDTRSDRRRDHRSDRRDHRRDHRSDRRDDRRDHRSDRRDDRRDHHWDRRSDWHSDWRDHRSVISYPNYRRDYHHSGYRNDYVSGLGISFNFGTPGYSRHRWAHNPHAFYRPAYGAFSHYQRSTFCQRVVLEGWRRGRSELVSVVQCSNPWDGTYIVQGTEQLIARGY